MCPRDSAFAIPCEPTRLVRVAWHSVGRRWERGPWSDLASDPADRGSGQLSRSGIRARCIVEDSEIGIILIHDLRRAKKEAAGWRFPTIFGNAL